MTANLQLTHEPEASTAMRIRKPVAEVFEAVVNPEIITKYWFTKSSGRLEEGKTVQWEWGMYDFSISIVVKKLELNHEIVFEWPGESGATIVEWKFESLSDGTTFVRVRNYGFVGDADQLVKSVADSGQGFTWVLAGMKAYLEHNVELNLVVDRFPKEVSNP